MSEHEEYSFSLGEPWEIVVVPNTGNPEVHSAGPGLRVAIQTLRSVVVVMYYRNKVNPESKRRLYVPAETFMYPLSSIKSIRTRDASRS